MLPLIARVYPPPPPPPEAALWTGTTDRGHPVTFKISANGSQWSDFELTTDLAAPNCNVTYSELTVKTAGPASISGGWFGQIGGVFSFTGQLDSETSAHGTYAFSNYPFVVGLQGPPFVCIYYLTQSGTWNAGRTLATPTPTATQTQLPTATSPVQASATPSPTDQPTLTPTQPQEATPTPTPTSTAQPTLTLTPTRTATPAHTPVPGVWSGTTSRAGGTVAFTVSGDSSQWSMFDLVTDYAAPSCGVNGQVDQLVPGPGSVSGGHISYDDATFSMSGEFGSSTTASGTYSLTGYPIVIGLPYPPYVCVYYLTQSGTWTAHGP